MTAETDAKFHGLLLSSDLLFSSQAAGAFAQAGGMMHEAMNAAGLIATCQQHPMKLVLVDLTTAGLDLNSLVATCRAELDPTPTLLAFGPHVRAGLLSAAREAGFDQVLTRGQMHEQLGEILGQLSG